MNRQALCLPVHGGRDRPVAAANAPRLCRRVRRNGFLFPVTGHLRPGGPHLSAEFLAHAGKPDTHTTPSRLAAHAGFAPINRDSGTTSGTLRDTVAQRVEKDRPSALLDAGQYWSVGEMYAEVGEGLAGTVQGAWDEDTWERMLECLASAVAAVDEVLSFIPLGADRLPAEMFRTPTGRTQHRRRPELFTRGRLMRERAQRQQRLEAFVTTVPEPGDD